MEVNRATGNDKITAIAVTQMVPTIKGRKPNSPSPGFQSEEEIKCQKPACSKTGTDFRYKPIPIKITIKIDAPVIVNINPPAILFLIILFIDNIGIVLRIVMCDHLSQFI